MRISVKKFLVLVCCVGFLITGYLVGVNAQKNNLPVSGFLQSTSSIIQLGIWDKMGVSKSNNASFIVTASNGKQYRANKSESLNDWVYVLGN